MVSAMTARHSSETSRTTRASIRPAFRNGAVSRFQPVTNSGTPTKAIQNKSTRIGTLRTIST